jgi:hypothetical protein
VETTRDEQRLLAAIGYRDDIGRLVEALENVLRFLSAAVQRFPSDRARRWVSIAEELLRKCGAASIPEGIQGVSSEVRSTAYQSFVDASARCELLIGEARLNAASGLVISYALSMGHAVPSSIAAELIWLRSQPRTSRAIFEWKTLAEAFPLTEEEIADAESKIRSGPRRRLLAYLRAALRSTVAATEELARPADASAYRPADGHSQRPYPSNPTDVDADTDPEDRVDEATERHAGPLSLVRWKLSKSVALRDQLGAEARWDRLHVLALKATVASLLNAFGAESELVRNHAALAFCCLSSGLPSSKAIRIPLNRNDDLWLDLAAGVLVWNIRLARDSDYPCEPPNDEELIHIRLDVRVVSRLRELITANPRAESLSQLLAVPASETERKSWLREYRLTLRRHGDPLRKAYDARFAASLGAAYLHVTGHDLWAAMLALDFSQVAAGTLHYAHPSEAALRAREERVAAFLGLELAASPMRPLERHWLSAERYRAGLAALQEAARQAFVRLQSASKAPELLAIWDTFSCATLGQLLPALGMRGHTLHRLSLSALYSHPDYVLIYDKDVGDDLKYRLLPRTSTVAHALDLYARGLDVLQARLRRLRCKHRRTPTLSNHGPRTPSFFRLISTNALSTALKRAPVDRKGLAKMIGEAFGRPELNVGRHYLVTALLEGDAPRHLVRVLTGHAIRGAEVSGDASLLPPKHAIGQLADALERETRVQEVPRPARPRVSPRLRGPLPGLNDPYLHPKIEESGRILPAATDAYLPIALAVTSHARRELSAGRGPHNPASRFVLSLACFNAIPAWDLRQIWDNLDSILVGTPGPLLRWQRPGAMQISIPLLAPSYALLKQPMLDQPRDHWHIVVADIGAWVRRSFPMLPWPEHFADAATTVLALIGRNARFIVPPAPLAGLSDAIASATYSDTSLVRISDPDRPITPPFVTPVPSPARARATPSTQSTLDEAAAVTRYVGRNDLALGGQLRRTRLARERLEPLLPHAQGPAAALVEWLLAECEVHERQSPDPERWSTLRTYTSEVMTGLRDLRAYDDPREWDEDEWTQFVADTRKALRHRKDHRTSGLHRFLRIGATLNWRIPAHVYSQSVDPRQDRLRVSAASTAVLEGDSQKLQMGLAARLAQQPLLLPAASLAAHVLFERGLRSGELLTQTFDCIDNSTKSLVIATGPHSALKSDNAARAIPVSSATRQVLDEYRAECCPGSRYLFLDDTGNDWTLAHQIADEITEVLRQISGSPVARLHCFRSSAEMRQLLLSWEAEARALLRGESTPSRCAAWIERLAETGFCALGESLQRMGLGSASVLITYYMPAWPFVVAAAMHASLVDERPTCAFVAEALGSIDAYRKARSHAGGSFDVWPYLLTANIARLAPPPLLPASSLASSSPAGSCRAPTPLPVVPPVSRLTIAQFIAASLAGATRNSIAHRLGISTSRLEEIDGRVGRHAASLAAISRLGPSSPRERRPIQEAVLAPETRILFEGLLSYTALDRAHLLADLAMLDAPERARSNVELVDRLDRYLVHLPSSLGLAVRPSRNNLDVMHIDLRQRLPSRARLRADVRARLPVLLVCPMQGPTSVQIGRVTHLVRICVLAAHIAQEMHSTDRRGLYGTSVRQ